MSEDLLPSSAVDSNEHQKPSFWVVGVGASLGGLEALQALLASAPADAPIAWVIAQHSASEHESQLPALLGSICALEVRLLEAGSALVPKRIHIIPPGQNLRLDGERCIFEAPRPAVPSPSADVLFVALAESFGEASAGIVLSGTGHDGTAGLRAIRAAGGVTIAQDPETAVADGMPRKAINDRVVDAVLRPEAIAPELARILRHTPPSFEPSEDHLLKAVTSMVAERTGIDFERYRTSSILRRVRRRMGLRGVDDMQAYALLLEQQPEELEKLGKDLLIGVTSFFRDREAFIALRQAVSDMIARNPAQSEWRVWVPACSTGEEAYSVAIVFAECLGEAFSDARLVVYATDADAQTVEIARKGHYGEASLAVLDDDLRTRYLQPISGTYSVAKRLRDKIVFARQDLLADPPFSHLDLLACRNLFIYLEASTQNELLRLFHHALRGEGLLFLGRSESIGRLEHLFEPISKSHRIFRRSPHRPDPNRTTTRPRVQRRIKAPPPVHTGPRLSDLTARAIADAYDHPAVLVDGRRQVLHGRGPLYRYFALREGDFESTIVDLAVDGLRPALRHALLEVSRRSAEVRKTGLRIARTDGPFEVVDLRVRPVPKSAELEQALLILIEPKAEASEPIAAAADELVPLARVSELEAELAVTRESLQDSVEELETLNEELDALNQQLQSANEELQSSNEELATSNEEIQATNEELSTVNEELRATTRELREANVGLQSILRCVTTPLVVVGPDLYIKELSHSAVSALGLPDSCRGCRLSAVADHPILRVALERIAPVLSGSGPDRQELEVRGRHLVAEVHSLYAPDTTVEGAIILVHDVTDTRQREREFVALAEGAPDVVMRFDREGRHLYVNRALERYTGRPREEWLGRTNRELGLDEALSAPVEGAIREVLEQNTERTVSFDFSGPDGTHSFELRCVPELDAQGEVRSVIGVSRDMTEQVRTHRQLVAEKSRTDRLLASVSDGFLALEGDFTVTYFNTAAAQMLGRSRAEVLGRKLFDAFPEARGSVFEERYQRALREQRPDDFEIYFEPHGEWYRARVYPQDDGLIVFFTLTTEQKRQVEDRTRLEMEFHHAQKMQALGTLSGGVAHEFNNILATVKGFSSLLLEREDLAGDAIEEVQEIDGAAERGRSLVQQILTFSRKRMAEPRPANLNEVVRGVGRILESTLDRGVELELRLEEDLHSVRADEGQIEQVLLNLASNARDALAGHGQLVIATRNERIEAEHPFVHLTPGDYVCLSVTDNGEGMNDEVKHRAFEPFFTTKSPGAGTGLGLSTVYGIVRTHGGHIACESRLGEGTRFDIWLPTTREVAQPAGIPAVAATPHTRGQGELVLIADDEAPLRRFYERVLRAAGYEPLLAESAEQALQVFDQHRAEVSLILVDLGMPGMGGLEGVRQLRAQGAKVPIVVATGYATERVAEEARTAGAGTVLPKPFGSEALLRMLQQALEGGPPVDPTPRR